MLIEFCNNSKHPTIGMKPKDVTTENEIQVLTKFEKRCKRRSKPKPKFKVSDKVHMSKIKQVFEKGYAPNWSTELLTIIHVAGTNTTTYRLKDYRDQPISEGFHEQELQKTKNPDIYLVEKVLRRRGQ
ncbi:uncharacterized protein LOC106641910 [Copidosoma floridanum]|uniref:uncharacterized protein LOC106641910 n=1 Tax=Copidosoma floridanum TaxID=29053 RepID=UPI0006C93EAA|nr:uncharacterized protein LOC106641910 [Copidosoma floridanum]